MIQKNASILTYQDGRKIHLWEDLSDQIHSFLQSISLADLVTKNEVKKISENQDQRQVRMNGSVGELRLTATTL